MENIIQTKLIKPKYQFMDICKECGDEIHYWATYIRAFDLKILCWRKDHMDNYSCTEQYPCDYCKHFNGDECKLLSSNKTDDIACETFVRIAIMTDKEVRELEKKNANGKIRPKRTS